MLGHGREYLRRLVLVRARVHGLEGVLGPVEVVGFWVESLGTRVACLVALAPHRSLVIEL